MDRINPRRAGFIGAILLCGWHAFWSVLVASGVGQQLLDFLFSIQFMRPAFVLESFSWARATSLLLVTTTIGYFVGWTFAIVWNAAHPTCAERRNVAIPFLPFD